MQNMNARKGEDLRNIRKSDLENLRHKEGNSPLKEFEKQYKQQLDLERMAVRNRTVSNTSPFDKANAPPPGYLIEDTWIPQKPTKINPNNLRPEKPVAMAGHASPIADKILTLGSKKAMHITTMDWGLGASTKSYENFDINSERPYAQNPGFMRPHTSMLLNTSPNRFNE